MPEGPSMVILKEAVQEFKGKKVVEVEGNTKIIDKDLLLELLDVAKTVAAKVMGEKGAARVLTNLGEYQDSKHLHFHVYSGEKIR